MRPVILLGRPKGLEEGGWEEGTPESLRLEWTRYIQNIATLSGLFLDEGGDLYPEWIGAPREGHWARMNMYLFPNEWVWDKDAKQRRSFEEILDLAREQGKLDERFKWDDDPRDALRAVVAVFAKYVEAERKKREEAIKVLVGR